MGGKPVSPAGVSSLTSVSPSVLQLAGREAGLCRSRSCALASAAAACTRFLGGERLHLDARRSRPASCWPSSVSRLSLSASGARPTISRVCASSAVSWRSSLATLLLALASAASRGSAGARGARRAVVSSLRRASAASSAVSGLVERGERLLLEVAGQRASCLAERLDLGLEARRASPWPRRSAPPRAPCRGRAARRALATRARARRRAAPRARGSPARS